MLFVVSEDWYFVSHRLHLAQAAIRDGYRVALLTRSSRHRDLIESSGIELIEWPLERRSRNPLKELRALWSVVAAIRRFRPDIVHSVAMKPVLYSALACRLTGVRARVAALGGLGFIFSSRRAVARALRPAFVLALRFALGGKRSRIILQNPDDRASLLSARAVGEENIRLIRGAGVDTLLFSPGEERDGDPLVVLPARMLWDKGVADFVSCARAARARGIGARFALVGEPDPHNPECVPVAQLERWAAEGVVEWWGRRDDMPVVLSQAAIVCLPSSYGEGLPKSLLEAASCGRPIVTYDMPGCREVVVDGVNGYLVRARDEQALLAALTRLLADGALRRRFGEAGRELVLREFSQERVAQETARVWEEVLA